jgi:hypothetical protein
MRKFISEGDQYQAQLFATVTNVCQSKKKFLRNDRFTIGQKSQHNHRKHCLDDADGEDEAERHYWKMCSLLAQERSESADCGVRWSYTKDKAEAGIWTDLTRELSYGQQVYTLLVDYITAVCVGSVWSAEHCIESRTLKCGEHFQVLGQGPVRPCKTLQGAI